LWPRRCRRQNVDSDAGYRLPLDRGDPGALRAAIHKTNGIYRAILRGDFTHIRAGIDAVASELLKGNLHIECAESTLLETRRQVERGWRTTSDILIAQGHPDLAAQVRRFVDEIPPPRTEKEQLAASLLQRARESCGREFFTTR
jgi:hypothetical protein